MPVGFAGCRAFAPTASAMTRSRHSSIRIRTRPGHRTLGWLFAGHLRIPVALGRGGIKADKREGDGGTPRGRFHPLRVWYRADRGLRPTTALPLRRIRLDDAWCEDPQDRRYNRPFRRRAGAPGDLLARVDHLYDVIVEIDHNTRPRIAGRGSAVFLHLARPNWGPTAGCVAMTGPQIRRLVAQLRAKTEIDIQF